MPINFTSRKLTALTRQEYHSPQTYQDLLDKNPAEDRYLGEVPWGNDKKVQEIFSKFAQNIFTPKELIYTFDKEIACFERDLEKTINKDVKLRYLNQGTYGKIFKLTAGDDVYALKVFHSETPSGYLGHGKGAEVLNAVFARANTQKDLFAEFYFGKFARENDTDGFMLTKFIDGENEYPPDFDMNMGYKAYNVTTYIGTYDIKPENFINGKIVDYGGFVFNEEMKDSEVRAMTKLITKDVYTLTKANDITEIEIDRIKKEHGSKPEYKAAVEYLAKKSYYGEEIQNMLR